MAACSTLPLWHVLSLLGVVTIVCGATGGLASYLLMGPMPRTTHYTLPTIHKSRGRKLGGIRCTSILLWAMSCLGLQGHSSCLYS